MKGLGAPLRTACLVVTAFATVFLSQAEPNNKSVATTQHKKTVHVIHIVDQNGRPAVNGARSPKGVIVDVQVGAGFAFDPDTVTISPGTTVRWTWAGNGHSVTSGDPCTVDGQFCSPDDTNCDTGTLSNTGTVYEHTFGEPGTFSYFCFAHCALGMTGTVNVISPTDTVLYGSNWWR